MKFFKNKILILFIGVLFLACGRDSDEPFRIVNVRSEFNPIYVDTSFTVEFSKIARPSTINNDTFVLLDDNNETLEAEVSYDNTIKTAILKPKLRLKLNTRYTIRLGSGISSYDGRTHISEETRVFQTLNGTWHDPIRVGREDQTSREENHEVALDDNGRAWIVWEQTNAETGYSNIYYGATLLGDRDGPRAGYAPIARLDKENRGDARFPKIAIKPELYKFDRQQRLSKVRLSVVWQQYDGVKTNIWSLKYGIDAWGRVPQKISSVEKKSSRHPEVSMDKEGRVMSIWEENNSTVGLKSVAIKQNLNEDHSYTWSNGDYFEIRGDDFSALQLSKGQGPKSMILYQQHRDSVNKLLVRPYADFTIVCYMDAFLYNGDVVPFHGDVVASDMSTNQKGDAAIIWAQTHLPTNNRRNSVVFIAQYDNSTKRWKNFFKALILSHTGINKVKISIDKDQNVMALWKEGVELNYRYYSASKDSWDPFSYFDGDDDRHRMRLASNVKSFEVEENFSGSFFVVWSERTGSPARYKIFVSKFKDGHRQEIIQLSTNTVGDAHNPKLSVNSLGFAVVVWQEYDENGVSHLMSSSFE